MYGKPRMLFEIVLAKRIGKARIMQFTALMLTYCRKGCGKPIDEIIQMFFSYDGNFNQEGYAQVMENLVELQLTYPGFSYGVLSEEALLNLYIWIANRTDISEEGNGLEEQNSQDMLKLLLLFNEKVLERFNKASKSANRYKDRTHLRRIFAERFALQDIIDIDYPKLVYTQFFKLMKLLNFLEGNAKYKAVYEHFLNDFKVASKEEFFKAVGGAVISPLNLHKTGINSLVIENNAASESNAAFLDNLAHSAAQADQGPTDYRFLRDKPLQKVPGEFRVVFDYFLIKKLYNGLVFKLSAYVKNDPTLFKGSLFGPLRDEFTEAVLVYETMDAIFTHSKSVTITGNEFKAQNLQREPDYYCRHDNKIILVESKDFFMPADKKLSYDFDIIMGGLSKDDKGKIDRLKKAALQAATNTGRALLKGLPMDNAYDPGTADIYPSIAVHDSLYDTLALNYWVNEWYQEELNKLKSDPAFTGVDFSRVRPITMIDIDTLILYQLNFERGELNLFDMIEAYQKYVDVKSASDTNFEKAIIPFSAFAREYAEGKGVIVDLKLLQDTYQISGYIDN